MITTIDKATINKFDISGPRYTSYPTAPIWTNDVNESVYIEKLRLFGLSNKTLSLYIHIPFCQTLCSYCACNVIIRKDDEKYGDDYLAHLFKEIDLVVGYLGHKKKIRQLHWGGGTPTFLTETQIERLFNKINNSFDIDFTSEVAIEIDPRTINQSKLKKLKSLGFNRISLGVQDFDEQVQQAVNRIQPLHLVEQLVSWSKALNISSINFDLIYGLPYQTPTLFKETISKVIKLRPDRIALYSFAHVPWLKKHQRKMDEAALPSADEKMDIFMMARREFLNHGYQAIAMDHFALETDELAQAYNQESLYRNFMGYTVKPADEYLGLGLTSIGFLENTFIQNHKVLRDYYDLLDQGKLPIERGKVLNLDDRLRQWVIRSLMCHFKIDKKKFFEQFKIVFDEYFQQEQIHLRRCTDEGLITIEENLIKVTDMGKLFVRNVCMGFDYYLQNKESTQRFSRTI